MARNKTPPELNEKPIKFRPLMSLKINIVCKLVSDLKLICSRWMPRLWGWNNRQTCAHNWTGYYKIISKQFSNILNTKTWQRLAFWLFLLGTEFKDPVMKEFEKSIKMSNIRPEMISHFVLLNTAQENTPTANKNLIINFICIALTALYSYNWCNPNRHYSL